MISLLLILELVLVVALIPWFGLLAAVLVAALVGGIVSRDRLAASAQPSSRFLILIPAHDEAGVIGVTVASCRAVDYPPDQFQIFVIADNCADATGELAVKAGAEVVVRADMARRSKGFALEDFFRMASSNPSVRPFDAYVLVDADTSVAPDLLRAFDQSLCRGDDFIQGYYTVRNADASWRTRLMTYAFSLVNGVWLLGTDQLGLSVGLKGNGMCFRAAALDRFPWQAHGLVEDMEYAWSLRTSGGRVRFQPLAHVYGEMVSRDPQGSASQRRRWEVGRRALRTSVGAQIWQSPQLSTWRKIAYAVDLRFPPLSRLVVGLGLTTLIGLIGIWTDQARSFWNGIATLLVLKWALLLTYLLSPLIIMKLPPRYLLSLMNVPYFMLWKLTIGTRKTPENWVRTPREASASVSQDRP